MKRLEAPTTLRELSGFVSSSDSLRAFSGLGLYVTWVLHHIGPDPSTRHSYSSAPPPGYKKMQPVTTILRPTRHAGDTARGLRWALHSIGARKVRRDGRGWVWRLDDSDGSAT